MSDINVVAILVAAAAGFVISMVWYALVSVEEGQAQGNERPPAWKFLVEFGRSLTVAAVVGGVVNAMDIDGWIGLISLAVALWFAFPVVLLVGSSMWERVPWRVAALHGGDWLVKLVVITVIVGRWG